MGAALSEMVPCIRMFETVTGLLAKRFIRAEYLDVDLIDEFSELCYDTGNPPVSAQLSHFIDRDNRALVYGIDMSLEPINDPDIMQAHFFIVMYDGPTPVLDLVYDPLQDHWLIRPPPSEERADNDDGDDFEDEQLETDEALQLISMQARWFASIAGELPSA